MNNTPITLNHLARSVIAVPPLARLADLSLDVPQNRRIIEHLEAGGVRRLLYGGNANFYHIGASDFALTLDMLTELTRDDTHVIPSVAPNFGLMLDQAKTLRGRGFPAAMLLPVAFPVTSDGVAIAVRQFVEAARIPVVLYIKSDRYVEAGAVAQLAQDGLLAWIKYAVVRDDPADDGYLRELTQAVDPKIIVSGIGEQLAIIHLRDFGLGGFTSGCICVAPTLSMQMLRAIKAGQWDEAERLRQIFEPLEDLRNAHSPIRVLHEAVRLAGVAETGPMLPMLTNLEPTLHEEVRQAAATLLQLELAAPTDEPRA